MYLLAREKYIALSPKLYNIKRREKEHTKMKQQQWEKQIEGTKGSIFALLMEQGRELGLSKVKMREDGLGEVVRLGGSQARDQHPWTRMRKSIEEVCAKDCNSTKSLYFFSSFNRWNNNKGFA